MSNDLLISRNVDFTQLMHVANGMLYNHEHIYVRARGKQIQRAIEILCTLCAQEKIRYEDIRIGTMGNTNYIPTLDVHVGSRLFNL